MSQLFIAVLVTGSLVIMGIGNVVELHRRDARMKTAAEALAIAATVGGSLKTLADSYDLDAFIIERESRVVTARVWIRGSTAEATAVDHRRTID